jgi:transmembrane sensor
MAMRTGSTSSASSGHSAPPARDKLAHALLLIARMQGGEPAQAEAARRALDRWRASHPDHEMAYGAAQAGWHATSAEALRGDVPLPLPSSRRTGLRGGRRQALSTVLGLGVLALGVGGLVRWHVQQPMHELALQTLRGQTQSATLPDGSQLALDARTQARVVFYRDRREVWLGEGEIRFSVQPDADRPFIVVTDWGRVRVLGTVFTVEARAQRMRVAVATGRVGVWARGLGGHDDMAAARVQPPESVLTAGQAVTAEAGALGEVHGVPADDVGAWQRGWLVFDGTPLPQAVARWNDYLATPLRLDVDPALQGLRLTGSFPLRSPDVFVNSLPGILPVRLERGPGGAVRIVSRR